MQAVSCDSPTIALQGAAEKQFHYIRTLQYFNNGETYFDKIVTDYPERFGNVGVISVSYTHLTLPTNREV